MKKRILAVALSVALCVGLLPFSATAAKFNDTSGHWAEKQIDKWSGYGVVNGNGDGTFNPNGNMTRAEACQTLANLLSLTEKADLSAYTDVGKGEWYDDAISKCLAANIITGVSDNQMNPKGTLTREMFFVMFARALGIQPEDTCIKTFNDSASISSWAVGYVNALINHGYVSGITDSTLAPSAEINRASVVALMDKTIVSYEKGGTVQLGDNGEIKIVAEQTEQTEPDPVTPTPTPTPSSGGGGGGGGGGGHSHYYVTVEEATCTEAGLKQCSCGATQEIPALGHDFENGICIRCEAFEIAVDLDAIEGIDVLDAKYGHTGKDTAADDQIIVTISAEETVEASDMYQVSYVDEIAFYLDGTRTVVAYDSTSTIRDIAMVLGEDTFFELLDSDGDLIAYVVYDVAAEIADAVDAIPGITVAGVEVTHTGDDSYEDNAIVVTVYANPTVKASALRDVEGVDEVAFWYNGEKMVVAEDSTTTIYDIAQELGEDAFFALYDADGNLIAYVAVSDLGEAVDSVEGIDVKEVKIGHTGTDTDADNQYMIAVSAVDTLPASALCTIPGVDEVAFYDEWVRTVVAKDSTTTLYDIARVLGGEVFFELMAADGDLIGYVTYTFSGFDLVDEIEALPGIAVVNAEITHTGEDVDTDNTLVVTVYANPTVKAKVLRDVEGVDEVAFWYNGEKMVVAITSSTTIYDIAQELGEDAFFALYDKDGKLLAYVAVSDNLADAVNAIPGITVSDVKVAHTGDDTDANNQYMIQVYANPTVKASALRDVEGVDEVAFWYNGEKMVVAENSTTTIYDIAQELGEDAFFALYDANGDLIAYVAVSDLGEAVDSVEGITVKETTIGHTGEDTDVDNQYMIAVSVEDKTIPASALLTIPGVDEVAFYDEWVRTVVAKDSETTLYDIARILGGEVFFELMAADGELIGYVIYDMMAPFVAEVNELGIDVVKAYAGHSDGDTRENNLPIAIIHYNHVQGQSARLTNLFQITSVDEIKFIYNGNPTPVARNSEVTFADLDTAYQAGNASNYVILYSGETIVGYIVLEESVT